MVYFPFSVGEFTINISNADRDEFVNSYGNKLRKRGLLDTEPGLEDQIKKLIHPSVASIRCPLAWELRYNDFGQITHRVTKVETAYTDDNGKCKAGALIIQQVKFSDKWSPAEFCSSEGIDTWGAPNEELPCQNFNLVREW